MTWMFLNLWKKLNPPYLNSMFEIKEIPYETRKPIQLVQPLRHTTTYGLRTISYTGAKLWNDLPFCIEGITVMCYCTVYMHCLYMSYTSHWLMFLVTKTTMNKVYLISSYLILLFAISTMFWTVLRNQNYIIVLHFRQVLRGKGPSSRCMKLQLFKTLIANKKVSWLIIHLPIIR